MSVHFKTFFFRIECRICDFNIMLVSSILIYFLDLANIDLAFVGPGLCFVGPNFTITGPDLAIAGLDLAIAGLDFAIAEPDLAIVGHWLF